MASLAGDASPELAAEPTSKNDAAFWLYSSGTTGFPKGCVHLHHDMVYCAEYYAKGILGISEQDRTFSVAKLFFAYGLGNGLYFPFSVGGLNCAVPRPANGSERPPRHRAVQADAVLLGADELRDAPGPGRQARSQLRSAGGVGRRGVARADLPVLSERFLDRFGVQILDGIGSTEVLHIFISNRPGDVQPRSSRPRWIQFVEALPKTANGKTQRFKLRQLAMGQDET